MGILVIPPGALICVLRSPRAHARNALAGGNPPTTRPCIQYWQKNALAVTMRKIRKSVRLADTLQSRQPPAADGLWQRRRRIVVTPPTDCGSAADGLWQRHRRIVATLPTDCGNAAAGLKPCGLLARMRAMPWQVGIPHHPPVYTVLAKKCTANHNAKNPQKCAIGRHFTKQAVPTVAGLRPPHQNNRTPTPTDCTRRHAMPDSKTIRCPS